MEALGLLAMGFKVLFTWKILALMMVGLTLGIFVGVLPGLGGPNGVAILLPLTFTMDPTSGHRDALLHLLGARSSAGRSPRSSSTSPARRGRWRQPSTATRWRRRASRRGAHGRLHLVLHRLFLRGRADHRSSRPGSRASH
jgi:hypothetical protein